MRKDANVLKLERSGTPKAVKPLHQRLDTYFNRLFAGLFSYVSVLVGRKSGDLPELPEEGGSGGEA